MLFGLLASLRAQARFAFDVRGFFYVLELMLKRSVKISVEFLGSKADAVNDRMSLGLWWHLQHLVELLGNFTPQCPLKNNTTDTTFGRTAFQDVLLVLTLANFGKCVICSGLLTTGSALLPVLLDVWKMSHFEMWMKESCAVISWLLVLLIFLPELLGPFMSDCSWQGFFARCLLFKIHVS